MNKQVPKQNKINNSLSDKLFAMGFCFTNTETSNGKCSFLTAWNSESLRNGNLFVHPRQHYFISKNQEIILIGHAYNPFSMQEDETEILEELCEVWSGEKANFYEYLNQLTGIFTLLVCEDDAVYAFGDASGIQTTFYFADADKEKYVIASHTNLIGDLLSLEWDPYVKRLSGYRFFPLLGNSLPGDLTQFPAVKRLVPNYYVKIAGGKAEAVRFYWPHTLKLSEDEICNRAAEILHNNLSLIAEKWKRPAISMTGGCDSKTTMACANGLYDRFTYFSYISSEAEKVDAEAAKKICEEIGIKHTTYMISEHDEDYPEIEEYRSVLFWNNGALRKNNPNDVRKRAHFAAIDDFDVEVKSWVSEIGRAYYSKRFNGRKNFGKLPTPRACTTLYKFFLHDRRLVRQTDHVFAGYIRKYFEQAAENPLDWQEQFFWEFRVPSWNGIVITSEQRFSFDITIPYNNRKLLELLLSMPIEDRINDSLYKKIRTKMNPKIDEACENVQNLHHTHRRARFEELYWRIHSKFPL